MTRVAILLWLTVCALAACAAPFAGRETIAATARADVPSHSRVFTIDDNLRTERIGKATVLGDLFVWEQAPPYDEIGYYGVGFNGTWDAGAWLHAAGVDGADPRLLFEPEPGVLYWIASTSPEQRRLLYYGGGEDGFFLGVYDRAADRHRDFPVAPAVGSNGTVASTWVSEDRVAVVTLAEGRDPVAAVRPSAGRQRYEHQRRAWAGEVSATVSVSAGAPAPPERLVLLDAATGEVTALAEGSFFFHQARFPAMAASPDGRHLAVVGVGMAGLDEPNEGAADAAAGPQLAIFDLETGAARLVSTGLRMDPLDPGSLEWSPSGDELAFFAWPADGEKQGGVFHAVNVETGAVRAFPHAGLELASVHEHGWFQAPYRGLWVGDRLAVFGREHGGAAARFLDQNVWAGVRTDGGAAVPPQWYLVDDAGEVERLSTGLGDVSGLALSADGESITVLADGAAWRLEPGRAPANLTTDVGAVSLSPQARYVPRGPDPSPSAILPMAGEGVAGYVLLDFGAGAARATTDLPLGAELLAGDVASGRLLMRQDTPEGTSVLTASADGGTAGVGVVNAYLAEVIGTEWRPFEYEVSVDGESVPLTGCVLYPPDFDPERAYPVIVEAYPGIAGSFCTAAAGLGAGNFPPMGARPTPYSHHAWAAEGFIVLSPALPANLLRTEGAPIGRLPALTVAAVDALAREVRVDESRVNLFGFSYGGMTALWIASQTDRFDNVVAGNSASDYYFFYFESYDLQRFYEDSVPIEPKFVFTQPGWPFNMGDTPHAAPLAYIENSPIHHAPDISAPVLLIAADLDGTVNQLDAMFTALKAAGKEARIVRYWGEGHGPSSPGNIRDMHREIMEWFAQ